MPAKKVIIHIGLPKTGTTALQSALSRSPKFQRANSVLYPKAGQSALFKDSGHHALAIHYMLDRWDEMALKIERDYVETVWDDLLIEIDDATEETVFISSEWFAFDVHRLEDLWSIRTRLKSYDVEIVVVLRNIVDFVNSVYAQRVRDGYEGSISEYLLLAWPHLNWRELVERWSSVFGEDRVKVLHFEALSGADLIKRFLARVLGPDLKTLDLKPARNANARLPRKATELFLAVNNSGMESDDKHLLVDKFVRLLDGADLSEPPSDFLEEADRERLLKHCELPGNWLFLNDEVNHLKNELAASVIEVTRWQDAHQDRINELVATRADLIDRTHRLVAALADADGLRNDAASREAESASREAEHARVLKSLRGTRTFTKPRAKAQRRRKA